jgi:hypothetical protein
VDDENSVFRRFPSLFVLLHLPPVPTGLSTSQGLWPLTKFGHMPTSASIPANRTAGRQEERGYKKVHRREFPKVKRPEREVGYSPPSSVEVKSECL